MRKLLLCAVISFAAAGAASAQSGQPAQPEKLYASAADVTALIAKAKVDRKNNEPRVPEGILRLAPYSATLEYRPAVGPASIHHKQVELFLVIDGSATIVTGGKLVNPSGADADNPNGTAVEGGTSQNISKGDLVLVPENTPHWFSSIPQTLSVMSLHMPRPVAPVPGATGAAGKPTEGKLYGSVADIEALVAKAKAIRKDQANIPQTLLPLDPYNVNIEYRASVGNATVHVREAEMFYVVDGSATLVTGGKLVNQAKAAPDAENLAGDSIEGGTTRQIGKGDFIFVPENTPHWFSKIPGTLVVMSLHVPRPVPGGN